MIHRTKTTKQLVLSLSFLFAGPFALAQSYAGNGHRPKPTALVEPNTSAIVWHDPGDVSTLDLFYGLGGKEHAPDPNSKFKFIKEDRNGTSAKFDVEDSQGVRWRVKLGAEPQSETAATRLLWAAGYYVDEDYYLSEITVDKMPKLHRGEKWVSSGGVVHRARLERHVKAEKLGTWDWFKNQCQPQARMKSLAVMMALVNNWDLKTVNNTVEEVDGERRCYISDLGATLGKTGNSITRSKGVPKDYAHSKFIQKETPDHVDFVMHSRPFFLSVFNIFNYRRRTRMEKITQHIPREDAKWLGERLAPLSAEQIQDCFRAAGYTPAEVEEYTQAVQKRIGELRSL